MSKRRFRLPSPAIVISMIALALVLGGTAVASTATHGDKKADIKLIKKLAPTLSVKHAKTADSATNATNATNATHATSADSATNATNATTAANANTLGGYAANGLVRVARAPTPGDVPLGGSDTTVATVSITAPAAGFVLLQADYNTIGTGCPCQGWYLLKDNVNSATNDNYKITRIETSSVYQEGSFGWVFPVSAGVRTFQLEGHLVQGTTVTTDGAGLQALYVPFGSTGGATLSVSKPAATPTSTK